MKRMLLTCLAIGGAMVASVCWQHDAEACGGCMHQPPPANPPPNQVDTQVTAHRMAFAMSTQQTVLWDQISYSGNPKEFAWVLPVKPGTRVELSNDAWLAALDAATATVIEPPNQPVNCPGKSTPGYYNGGNADAPSTGCGGCYFYGCSSSDRGNGGLGSYVYGEDGGTVRTTPMPPPPPPVTVQTQEVVGPYDVVIVHSSKGEALDAWLVANGFEVPMAVEPIIAAYVKQGFDFVALKLAPGANERAMQPVRVTEPGADPSLPLRMVAAGVGANVAIELFVIGEGRYHPQNFPDVTIDDAALTYAVDGFATNYETLATAALAGGAGNGWLTEFSGPGPIFNGGQNTPALSDAYKQACVPTPGMTCGGVPTDAQVADGPGSSDDGPPADAVVDSPGDALSEATDDAIAGEAGAPQDASDAASADAANLDAAAEAATCTPTLGSMCDDLDVALMGVQDAWITRLRANLPASALATDLALEATPYQQPVSNVHEATAWVGNPCTLALVVPRDNAAQGGGSAQSCALGSKRRVQDGAGSAVVVVATALALAWMKRRRKRR